MLNFPDIDILRKQVTKINDEEIRAAFWLQISIGGPLDYGRTKFTEEDGLKAWGLFTEAEHFRAGLASTNPDESTWPEDYKQVLESMEKIADDFADSLFTRAGYTTLPHNYPLRGDK
jgi:hypothetical protein